MQVITVALTDKEYTKLRRKACLLGSGQVMGALRLEANLPELPYGYKSGTLPRRFRKRCTCVLSVVRKTVLMMCAHRAGMFY